MTTAMRTLGKQKENSETLHVQHIILEHFCAVSA